MSTHIKNTYKKNRSPFSKERNPLFTQWGLKKRNWYNIGETVAQKLDAYRAANKKRQLQVVNINAFKEFYSYKSSRDTDIIDTIPSSIF